MEIREGYLMLYYCFDVGYEIDLSVIEKRLENSSIHSFSFSRLLPRYVEYKVPPLFVRIGKKKIEGCDAELEAKMYNFGVMTIRAKFPIKGKFSDLAQISDKLMYSEQAAKFMKEEAKKLFAQISDSIDHPASPDESEYENYAIFVVTKLDRPAKAEHVLSKYRGEIAKAVKCDNTNLSRMEMNESVRTPLSYYDDEFVIIDFNASFIYNPHTHYEVPDVIEFAVIESLEMRYYDSLLDASISKAHSDISSRSNLYFSLSPYKSVLQNLLEVKLDITEVVDRITNTIKIFGDMYLSKVYHTTSAKLGLDQWKGSVKEKLGTITSIYEMLREMVEARRMLVLEAIIVIFFLIDIVVLLAGFF